MLLFALLACQESKIPEDALHYEVEVTAADIDQDGLADNCHPDATEGWQDTFEYVVALEVGQDGQIATTIYIGEQAFAAGTMTSGCDMEYQSVVMGETTDSDGDVRWQLSGLASFDAGTNDCTAEEDEGDWTGTETFEIVTSVDETLEEGCTYEMKTVGRFLPQE